MALPWNPNSPTVVGIEHDLLRHGRTALSTLDKAFVQKVVSDATESVTFVVLPFPLPYPDSVDGDIAGPDFPYRTILDVYDAEPEPQTITTTVFTPNAFTDRAGFTDQAGGTTNLHLVLDESPSSPDYSDYIISTSTGSSPKIDLQFGTAAWPSGRRVLDVRVRARVRGGDMGFQILNSNVAASQKIKSGYTGVVGSTGYRTVTLSFGEICPWNGRPWRATDIASFDSTTAEIRVTREDGSTGFFSPTIAALELQVLWVPETRVAHGYSTEFWNLLPEFSYDMETPSGGLSWSKVSGTTYWLAWRRARVEQNPYIAYDPFPAQTSFDVPWIEPPAVGHETWPESYLATTGLGGTITSLGTATARRAMYGLSTDAINGQPDVTFGSRGQPYGEVNAADLSVGPVRQRFVAPASANYSALSLAFVPGPLGGTAETTVRIRRVSDLVQIGGTATLDRETLTEQGVLVGNGTPGEIWRVSLVLSAAAALVSGTAYYVEISGGEQSPVYVDVPDGRAMDAYTPGSPQASITQDWMGQFGFGDDDGRAIIDVGTASEYESSSADLLFTFAQQPASLGGFTVEDEVQVLTATTPDTDSCPTIDSLPLAKISWTASALSDAQFVRYEVERYDPTTLTWTTIARLTSKTATTWYDPDIRFGVAEAYRVRQIAAGEVPSDYTGDETTTLLLDAPGCGLYFTVAEDQEWNMAALDVYGAGPAERDFAFLDDKVLVPMIGRDYQVAFQPAEMRGSSFSRTVLLNAISTLAVPTFDTFDPLRAIAKADVSAVCVRDHEGNRWYCSLVVPSGKLRAVGEFAWAQVAMTEVAAGPVAYEGRGQSLGGS